MEHSRWNFELFTVMRRCVVCGRRIRYGTAMEVDRGLWGTDRLVLCVTCDLPIRRLRLEEMVERRAARCDGRKRPAVA